MLGYPLVLAAKWICRSEEGFAYVEQTQSRAMASWKWSEAIVTKSANFNEPALKLHTRSRLTENNMLK
jgi:hypothetical protein